MERRIRRLGIAMIVCFAALFVQLNHIQILDANSLANNPENPHVIAVARSQPRGDILSADGVVLASSVPSTGTYKYQRVYNPATATLFSQIVGYDTIFGTRTGVEAEYNQYLESHTRPAKTLRDLLVNRTTTDNVTLTINSSLQLQVAGIVDGINRNGSAPQVGAVVINVKTGAIEAMYGNPTFNPTPLASQNPATVDYAYALANQGGPQSSLVSRTFQAGFLPGSTFKTVTSAAVYDRQPALAKLDIPKATCIPLPQSDKKLCNYGLNTPQGPESCGGTITVTLPASCDTAFAQLGMDLGGSSLTAEAQAFGFNQVPPIDLTGANASAFPSGTLFDLNKPSQAYSAFGQQNVVATPLQMALVAAGFADDGIIMTPHVMQQIRDSQGNLVTTYQPKPWLTATSPLTAAAVTQLMKAVTEPGGTAARVFPPSWNVAAKTGTAETSGAFGQPLTNDWMIAFAPANDPRVAVAVAVPNQIPSSTGAEISGPPTKAILGDALAATP